MWERLNLNFYILVRKEATVDDEWFNFLAFCFKHDLNFNTHIQSISSSYNDKGNGNINASSIDLSIQCYCISLHFIPRWLLYYCVDFNSKIYVYIEPHFNFYPDFLTVNWRKNVYCSMSTNYDRIQSLLWKNDEMRHAGMVEWMKTRNFFWRIHVCHFR